MEISEKEHLTWIWVSRLGRPVNKIIDFLETEYGDVQTAFDMTMRGEFTAAVSEKTKLKERLCDLSRIEEAKRIYNNAMDSGMRIINKKMSIYPGYLNEISCSPAVIYCYGKLPKEIEEERNEKLPMLAVVGARNCSSYGYGTALKISRVLAGLGVCIVSGMARGIDSAAHRGALESDAYTVAVLGSGADIIYPSENRHLYDEIKNTGCIISEFIPDTPPMRNNFPARNRIIAGMSQAVTVIEAGESSGAMITAGLAGEMGRDVYAVPGNIDNSLSYGANKLIQNGALCVTSYMDILVEMGLYPPDNKTEEIHTKEQKCQSLSDDDERAVFNAIKNGCYDLNSINEQTEIPFGRLRSILGLLEINRIIARNYDGFYYIYKAKN